MRLRKNNDALAKAIYARVIDAGLSPDVETWALVSDAKLETLLGPMTWLVYRADRKTLDASMRRLATSTAKT
jgi:hypothetical protein